MNYFKDNILPILIGALLSAIGALLLSISSDLAPPIIPVLNDLPTQLYLKLILLLSLLLVILSVLLVIIALKSKTHKPRSMKGSYSGFKWVAKLDYTDKRRDVSIEMHWLCPSHKTFLGWKDAEVPECVYHNLYCRKCDKVFELKSNNDVVYVEEAERLINQDILSKIRI